MPQSGADVVSHREWQSAAQLIYALALLLLRICQKEPLPITGVGHSASIPCSVIRDVETDVLGYGSLS